jgi:hypothetical protein
MQAITNNPHTDAIVIDTPPLIGSTSIMDVTLGGAISNVAFTLVDASSNVLGSATLALTSDSSLQPLEYVGSFTVPAVPFYVVASGNTGDGKTFTLKSPAIINPVNMTLAFSQSQALIAKGASLTISLEVMNAGSSGTFNVSFVDPSHLLNQPLITTVQVMQGENVSLPVTVTFPSTLAGTVVPTLVATASVTGDPSRLASTTFTAFLDGAP